MAQVNVPALSRDLTYKSSTDQSEEVKREMEQMRLHDEEEYRQLQIMAKMRIDKHLEVHRGSLSDFLPSIHLVKSIQLTSFGNNHNIKIFRVPLPLPLRNEVLIRTFSCGLNFHDLMERQGLVDTWVRSFKPPFIMGSELAGEIVGVGRDVTDFKLGDRVVALPERGAWSEYVVCRAEYCFSIPDEMNYHDAIALTTNGITAYTLLFELGNLRPGKTVLVHSAPGGLGNMVAQMCKSVPNVRLFKIATNPLEENQPESSVQYIDRDVDYRSEIRHFSPLGVDLVLDCQYEDNFSNDFNLLKPMGRYVLFGTQVAVTGEGRGYFQSAKSWWGGAETVSPLKLYEENKSLCSFNLRHLLYFQRNKAYVQEVVDKVFKMWKDGALQPVFDRLLHFDDFTEGMQRMLEHGQMGKIVFDPTMTKEDDQQSRNYFLEAESHVRGHDARKCQRFEESATSSKVPITISTGNQPRNVIELQSPRLDEMRGGEIREGLTVIPEGGKTRADLAEQQNRAEFIQGNTGTELVAEQPYHPKIFDVLVIDNPPPLPPYSVEQDLAYKKLEDEVGNQEVRQPRTEAELSREKIGYENKEHESGFFDKIRETFSPHNRTD